MYSLEGSEHLRESMAITIENYCGSIANRIIVAYLFATLGNHKLGDTAW
jgi:hypothetical protein